MPPQSTAPTPTQSNSSARSVWAAFREGAVRPNLLSLAIAAVVALLPFVLVIALIDEDFVISPRGRALASSPIDGSFFVTAELLRLEDAAAPGLRLVLVGASSTRGSVNVPLLEEELSAQLGEPVRCHAMASGAQTIAESHALMERASADGRCIVVVGVGATTLSMGHPWASHGNPGAAWRYGFRSPTADQVALLGDLDLADPTGNYAWDNRRFLIPRVLEMVPGLLGTPEASNPMPHRGEEAPTKREWRKRTKGQATLLSGYEERSAEGFERLGLIADTAEGRAGVQMILLGGVMSERFAEEHSLQPILDDAAKRLDAFSAERGVPVLQLQEAAGLVHDHFADGTHLRVPEAIDRYTRELASAIAALRDGEEKGR